MFSKKNKKLAIKIIFQLNLALIFILILILLFSKKTHPIIPTAPYIIDEKNVNTLFEDYIGIQRASMIKQLLTSLAGDSELFENFTTISITYIEDETVTKLPAKESYKLSNKIKNDFKYDVSFKYSETGIINEVIINAILF